MAFDVAPGPALRRDRIAFAVKWVASVVQIAGYAATAFGVTPLNLYLFIGGVIGWFAVGAMWQDRAIMLIHVVALGSMLAGLASG
ncbi:DUF6552 family protein [Limimaricola pyoseonensis]|uniref:Ubiquinone biosynthesis methyltransferase UbiE n=1 Tax=Limimaricola pyoseonensis TaxID=521013 RepID=A0A1G7DED0_9RHOB|nr:DUF6552 family protein [Limimaricola pyoseonensis]SDE49863.1 hypothetical protein SAMN04488567_1902 [Limimaricola pyoseonensis]